MAPCYSKQFINSLFKRNFAALVIEVIPRLYLMPGTDIGQNTMHTGQNVDGSFALCRANFGNY